MSGLVDLITAAALRHGLDPNFLTTEAQIESGMNPSARNPSGASGLFQFIPSTAARYGVNPQDPASSAEGAARLASDNSAALAQQLGRQPTSGELYLAHQQGAGGAAGLLSNPSAPAASIVGTKAVIQNGGTQGMSAADFAGMWLRKYDKASGQQVQNVPVASIPSGTAIPNAGPVALPDAPVAVDPSPAMAAAAPVQTVDPAREALRRRALFTGQGGIAALFA